MLRISRNKRKVPWAQVLPLLASIAHNRAFPSNRVDDCVLVLLVSRSSGYKEKEDGWRISGALGLQREG